MIYSNEGVFRTQLKKVYVASRRYECRRDGDFTKKAGSAIAYCWFVWEKGFKGIPQIEWINTGD